MMQGKKIVALAAACALSSAMTATAYGAATTYEMKKKAVSLLGILTPGDQMANVTRAEFASMLVKASEYRYAAGSSSNVSVFADVPSTSEYASVIRTAASNEWMTGYLGGNFKPDQNVTLKDAARAALGILGYTNDDFSGNINENRMAKFSELGLDTDISRDSDEVLTRRDCINLFYNLLQAKTKNGAKYGTQVFDLSFNSDGEVNMSSILDDSLKGPKLLDPNGHDLEDLVPFSLKNASLFLDGYASDEDEINDEAIVIYYHESTKTVFAYSDDGKTKGASEGEILDIYYDSSDPFTPVTVVLDSNDQEYTEEDGDTFKLNSSEIQYLFSIYGEFKVGDDVAIVWEKNGSGENATYTAIDVVGDY